jgi:hypothetical protein
LIGKDWREPAGRTPDPSTALRSGRDDKGREVTQLGVVSGMGRNCRSLHYAPTTIPFDDTEAVPDVQEIAGRPKPML